MDYKAVIEEQIRELQKLQFKVLASKIGTADTACNVANTIALLCRELVRYQ